MSHAILNSEYRRRVFNAALLEAIRKPYLEALMGDGALKGEPVDEAAGKDAAPKIKDLATEVKNKKNAPANEGASQPDLKSADAAPTEPNGSPKKAAKNEKPLNSCGQEDLAMCESMCDSYFTEELGLNEATISQTKDRLRGSNYYITEAVNEAEAIANNRAEDAKEKGETIDADDKIELSPEEHEALDQLFHTKGPGPQIDQIRDATVRALLQEEKKAKEVHDALDLAQSKVVTGDANAYNETANRISKVGPTSLMGGIINHMTRAAIREANEAGNLADIGDVMAENADLIKTRSVMLYAIMETGNQLEITHYGTADVERLSRELFYQK